VWTSWQEVGDFAVFQATEGRYMAAVLHAKRMAFAVMYRVRDLFGSGGVDMDVSASPSRFVINEKSR
jgi:hypothetical protein